MYLAVLKFAWRLLYARIHPTCWWKLLLGKSLTPYLSQKATESRQRPHFSACTVHLSPLSFNCRQHLLLTWACGSHKECLSKGGRFFTHLRPFKSEGTVIRETGCFLSAFVLFLAPVKLPASLQALIVLSLQPPWIHQPQGLSDSQPCKQEHWHQIVPSSIKDSLGPLCCLGAQTVINRTTL